MPKTSGTWFSLIDFKAQHCCSLIAAAFRFLRINNKIFEIGEMMVHNESLEYPTKGELLTHSWLEISDCDRARSTRKRKYYKILTKGIKCCSMFGFVWARNFYIFPFLFTKMPPTTAESLPSFSNFWTTTKHLDCRCGWSTSQTSGLLDQLEALICWENNGERKEIKKATNKLNAAKCW